jgi:hypothetical protein
MDDIVARDPRVEAILSSPDDYFDRAWARAWLRATADIATDMSRRASRRRNGGLARNRSAVGVHKSS